MNLAIRAHQLIKPKHRVGQSGELPSGNALEIFGAEDRGTSHRRVICEPPEGEALIARDPGAWNSCHATGGPANTASRAGEQPQLPAYRAARMTLEGNCLFGQARLMTGEVLEFGACRYHRTPFACRAQLWGTYGSSAPSHAPWWSRAEVLTREQPGSRLQGSATTWAAGRWWGTLTMLLTAEERGASPRRGRVSAI
jgi:hypothetical protein